MSLPGLNYRIKAIALGDHRLTLLLSSPDPSLLADMTLFVEIENGKLVLFAQAEGYPNARKYGGSEDGFTEAT